MKTICTAFLLLLLLSCTSSSEKLAWKIASNSQTNNKELTRFLEYYKTNKDKDKYKAACFLIENMPNKYSINGKEQKIYDIDIVKADSLIKSLEHSFFLKEKSPYLKNYTFEQFCEYILPYRVSDEPLQYYWKWDCSRKSEKQCTNDIIQTAQNINAQIKIELSPEFYKDTLKSYSSIIRTGYGKCDDRTALVTMALRSVGIPAAFEFVPYWGSNNNGHSFVSIILPDNKIYPLQNTDKQADRDYYLSRKTPKIYRKMYSIQDLAKHVDNIPELFRHNDILDVTRLHNIGSCDVTVSANINKEKENFLSVFSPKRWVPVAFSSSQTFHSIGTGNIYNVDRNKEAIDLGDGIVYLPTHWVDEEAIPIGSPIIVAEDSVREITPDTKHLERVVCKRKFPLNMRIVDFSKLMIMGVFEGANKADFSDATELYKITKTPESKMQKIEISAEKAYRYIRYRIPKGTFSIAEFCLYQSDEKLLAFRPIACDAIYEDSTMLNIFDGQPLTYYQVSGGIDLWVGVDLYKPVKISKIGFAPRNDDNAIVSTDTYELFYWQDQWISLGRKRPTGDSIVYDNVPQKALLWLHNLTKGREERPFTYENGKQIWW